jgi:hypothetical protein
MVDGAIAYPPYNTCLVTFVSNLKGQRSAGLFYFHNPHLPPSHLQQTPSESDYICVKR